MRNPSKATIKKLRRIAPITWDIFEHPMNRVLVTRISIISKQKIILGYQSESELSIKVKKAVNAGYYPTSYFLIPNS